jgi:hypothetical protein
LFKLQDIQFIKGKFIMPQATIVPTPVSVPVSPVLTRTIVRGANPFAPIAAQQNQQLTPNTTAQIYEALRVRGNRAHNNANVQSAIARLKARLNGQTYQQEHSGQLALARFTLLDLNIEIQRDEDAEHHAKIIDNFDPRIYMPVMCTKLKNGRYSAWEGQQTSCVLYHLWKAGIIDEDFQVQIKYFDEDLVIPGSSLTGEAVANYGFRQINGGMRKPIDAFHLHRSRVNGVRLYGSQLTEDIQSEAIQQVLERNHMFPAKSSDARGQNAKPGMVTYIHGLNLIAGHGTAMNAFNQSITDLDWALKWHDTYYPGEKGVDGGFILAFGRLAHAARTNPGGPVLLDHNTEADLCRLFKSKYGSPKGFHNDCKQRLTAWQTLNGLPTTWSDNALTPLLVMDYLRFSTACKMPQVPGMVIYAGI